MEDSWTVVTGKKGKGAGGNEKTASYRNENSNSVGAATDSTRNFKGSKTKGPQKWKSQDSNSKPVIARGDDCNRMPSTKGRSAPRASGATSMTPQAECCPGSSGSYKGESAKMNSPNREKKVSSVRGVSGKSDNSTQSTSASNPNLRPFEPISTSFKQADKGKSGINSQSQRVPKLEPNTSLATANSQVPVKNERAKSSTTAPAPSQPSTSTAAPQGTKKKKASKDVRRRLREQKFYQALNQKDSHVHFVTADMMKQMQQKDCVQQRTPEKCPPLDSPLFPVANLNTPLSWCRPAQGCGSTVTGDFPTLSQAPAVSSSSNSKEDRCRKALNPVQEEELNTPYMLRRSTLVNETTVQSVSNVSTSTASSPATPLSASTPLQKGKKSKQPMVIDVTSLIIQKKKGEPEKRNTITVGLSKGSHKENHKLTAGNPLDSSGPGVIHRGKIRQKKKKPTKLKLTILRSRALRKILIEKTKQEEAKEDCTNTNTEDSTEQECVQNSSNLKNEALSIIENEDLLPVDTVKQESVLKDVSRSETKTDDNPEPEAELETDATKKFIKLLDEISVMKIDSKISLEVEASVKDSMHNKKFRDYCDMYTSKEVQKLVSQLLGDLHKFQDRLYHTDPIKFKTKKRYVTGLKEALVYMNLNKVQLLIIAPDIEKNPEPGGLDDRISQILASAKSRNVPYIFSGNKYILGKPVRKKTPISIIAVLDKQNCEDTFRELVEQAEVLKEKYREDFLQKAKEISLEHTS